ncbi:Crp/Fnr family transcriptional regulator [Terrihabitans sp. B22-R8]|uniref:Crp/Fnr family transcriptional regulator n=1 Tax=Terrihabitans sp. B22-R8 TaxID=3425128 RepID=UPI00403CEBEE
MRLPLAARRPEPHANRLLEKYDLNLLALCASTRGVELASGEDLSNRRDQVFFPESGLICEIEQGLSNRSVATRCVGREGLVGIDLLRGPNSASARAICGSPVRALMVDVRELTAAAARYPELQGLLDGYRQIVLEEVCRNLLVAAHLTVQQRLACWLLSAFERCGPEFIVTHGTLATFLGVRRAGVTTALHILEGEKSIVSTRARVRLLDIDRLQKMAA